MWCTAVLFLFFLICFALDSGDMFWLYLAAGPGLLGLILLEQYESIDAAIRKEEQRITNS
jgi:hypothetical protein